MPIQWHPILVRLLRLEMSEELEVEEEHPLAEAPLRIDVLMSTKVDIEKLPSPYCYMRPTTLVQYKSPQDVMKARDVAKLEAYGILYQLDSNRRYRRDIGLCLAASRYASDFLQAYDARIEELECVEDGIHVCRLDGFSVCILELGEMRIDRVTLPWVIVGRGRNEREVIQYVVKHHKQLPEYVEHAAKLHWDMLMEVTRMEGIDIESLGFDIRKFAEDIGIERVVNALGIERLVNALGIERLINAIGIERVIDAVGFKHVVDAIGPERAMRELMEALGSEKFRELVEKLERDGEEREC